MIAMHLNLKIFNQLIVDSLFLYIKRFRLPPAGSLRNPLTHQFSFIKSLEYVKPTAPYFLTCAYYLRI